MESRSFGARGIQQEDVWSAADSLIADGLRPTIERVRQKIGRGSPNTVSPMLEAWFATLATRLGVTKQDDEPDQVPKALQQSLKAAWEIALTKGREEAALELVQAQDDLTRATQELQEREAELVQIEQVRAVKQQALEEAVDSARNITEDALARLGEAQQVASRRDTEIQNLHARLAATETEWDSEMRRHQQVTADYLRERQKIEERAQATQHRLLEEIDRARQETKKISSEAQMAGKQFSEERVLLREKIQTHAKEQAIAEALYATQAADLHSLREAFAVSDVRSNEFQALLMAQLDDSKKTVARLTQALLNRETGPAAGSRSLPSKFKRIRDIRRR
jgi:chromosome segregation ATPase